MLKIIFPIFLVSICSCSNQENLEGEVLRFTLASGEDGDGATVPYDACTITGPLGKVAIVRVLGVGQEQAPVCPDPNQGTTTNSRVEVVEEIYGSLPPEFTLTNIDAFGLLSPIDVGSLLLVSVRNYKGLTIDGLAPIFVSTDGKQAGITDSAEPVDLPSDLQELRDEVAVANSDGCQGKSRAKALFYDEQQLKEILISDQYCSNDTAVTPAETPQP